MRANNKVVLVGESNPYGGDPHYALYPYPEGCSGHRLCFLVLDTSMSEYLQVYDRVNLCAGKWSMREAREKAASLSGRYCVLLGSKVSAAFDVPFEPFEAQFPSTEDGGGGLLVLPHPSGLCRLWNEPGAFERARLAVAEFVAGSQSEDA